MSQMKTGSKRAQYECENGEVTNYVYDTSKIRKTDFNLKLRLLVIGRHCASVAGKGGENVKRMKREHNVRITGLNQRTNDRTITIEGEKNNCLNCLKKEIMAHCTEGPYSSDNFRTGFREINVLLNTDTVGSVIGKGGSQIKEISDQAHCKVKAYPDCLPNSNERVVAIGGDDEECVIAALELVLDIVSKFPSRVRTMYYTPDDTVIPMGVGSVGPNLGGMAPYNQMGIMGMAPSNPIRMDQNQLGMGQNNQIGMGQNNQMAMRPNNQMGMVSNNQMGMCNNQIMGMGNNQMGMMGNNQAGMGGNNQMSIGSGQMSGQDVAAILIRNRDNQLLSSVGLPDFQQIRTRSELTVPQQLCGNIIGKRGVNIKWVRDTSHAKIDFTQEDKNSKEDRTITIVGTQEQVQIAEQMMLHCARHG